jgi:hypothetical protein
MATRAGHAGQELGRPWRQGAGRLSGGDSGQGGRGRGPGGPPAYPGFAGEVGLAGGEAGSEQFEAVAVGTCEGGGDSGGDLRRCSSNASSRRKRTARGSY